MTDDDGENRKTIRELMAGIVPRDDIEGIELSLLQIEYDLRDWRRAGYELRTKASSFIDSQWRKGVEANDSDIIVHLKTRTQRRHAVMQLLEKDDEFAEITKHIDDLEISSKLGNIKRRQMLRQYELNLPVVRVFAEKEAEKAAAEGRSFSGNVVVSELSGDVESIIEEIENIKRKARSGKNEGETGDDEKKPVESAGDVQYT